MSLEILENNLVRMEPGPFDVHTHPRIFDAINFDNFVPLNDGTEGKAGLRVYTEAALKAGFTGMAAMPNESARIYDIGATDPEKTILVPFPIANLDRVIAAETIVEQEAVIPTGLIYGLDPEAVYKDEDKQILDTEKVHLLFHEVKDECVALKIYGGVYSTGGYTVKIKDIPELAYIWHNYHFEEPIIMHLEGDDVGQVLTDVAKLPEGKDIPIHIAHVSSQIELQAVVDAKWAGMNVTCEVTPHHLFLDKSAEQEIGGYGCMMPDLKTQKDIDFIWAHIDDVDIFASDCAPHRRSDKEKDNPAKGVTNHTHMLSLLLGAVADGKITYDQLYDKLCVKPRERFNLPLNDDSYTVVHARELFEDEVRRVDVGYGFEPFSRLARKFHLVGDVVEVKAGKSYINHNADWIDAPITSYTHLIRPHNLGLAAMQSGLEQI